MVGKINKLTPEQEARFPEFVQKWTDIGLCTDPADRPEAEKGVIEAYSAADLRPPEIIAWCGSPLGQGLTSSIILNKSINDRVKKGNLGPSTPLPDCVPPSVWEGVVESVLDSVPRSRESNVWKDAMTSIKKSEWDEIRAQVDSSVWNSVYGQHEAAWLAWFDYFKEVCGLVDQTKRLTGLWRVAKSAGWFLPYTDICWISERAKTLMRDDRGRLHNMSGPAIEYPDGWKLYYVHGVAIQSWVVEHPDRINVEIIEKETNAERRRVMLDKYGWDKYLMQSGAKLVHEDKYGQLYEKEIPGDVPLCMVKVMDWTPKYKGLGKGLTYEEKVKARKENPAAFASYFLRVKPGMKTAHAAVASTFNLTAEQYNPDLET